MRYSRIEKTDNFAYSNRALITSSKKWLRKTKEAKDGLRYYKVIDDIYAIFIPETHPFFNFTMFIYNTNAYREDSVGEDIKYDLADLLTNFANQIDI